MTKLDERIRQHYLLEKRLAWRILTSSRENRTQVAIEAYDELYSSIPWHPRLGDIEGREENRIRDQRLFFEHLIRPNMDILEVGAGTGYWIRYLAHRSNGRCVGVDISKETLIAQPDDPPNLELRIMDAVDLDLPPNSFDFALSSQLVEHLHPDDIEHHFASVYRALKENGVYAFDTPSRLNGPHDVSRHFDDVATCFHLREWTYRELLSHLKEARFRKIRTMILPWNLVKRLPFVRSLGTVPIDLLIPGERLAESIKLKRVRTVFCKLFRVSRIYIIAQK